jgi:hypothetical protein
LLKLEPTDDFLRDLVEFGNRNGLVSVEETFSAFYELEKNNASPLFNNFFFFKYSGPSVFRLLQVGLPMGNAPSKASGTTTRSSVASVG